MKKSILATLVILILAACSPEISPAITKPVPTQTDTGKPASTATIPAVSPTLTPAREQILTITGDVYVRNAPQGVRVGSLRRGDTAQGTCDGDWCSIDTGYIWRGCTDDNPEALGCLAK